LSIGKGLSGLGGRRLWIVIYGDNAPQGEIDNAKAIASALGIGARALPASSQLITWLSKFANIVVVGGSFANPYAVSMNDLVNPKWDITVVRAQNEGESWKDYCESGGIVVKGFIKDSVPYSGGVGKGFIGIGSQSLIRARALQVVMIMGWDFQDSCAMGKAFRDGQGAGIYNCSGTPTTDDTCDPNVTYTQIA